MCIILGHPIGGTLGNVMNIIKFIYREESTDYFHRGIYFNMLLMLAGYSTMGQRNYFALFFRTVTQSHPSIKTDCMARSAE